MEIKIIYVGNDNKYWGRLQQRFLSKYGEHDLEFSQILVEEYFSPYRAFKTIYQQKNKIIYLDFSIFPERLLTLCKLLNRNNVTRLYSTVGLYYGTNYSYLELAMVAGVRIHHIKSLEIHDVVYDPISFLDVNLVVAPPYAMGKGKINANIYQFLRVGWIDEKFMYVESDAPLIPQKYATLEGHPLKAVAPSCRFFVTDVSTSDLYFNMRYGMTLEFTYYDDDLFRATEKNFRTWLQFRNTPDFYHGDFDELEKDAQMRKERLAPIRKKIGEWISEKSVVTPKRVKVLVLDESLEIFDQINNKASRTLDYAINSQTQLSLDCYQIDRSRPHLIVVHFDQKINNQASVKRIIVKVKSLSDYNPYILIFNCKNEELKDCVGTYKNCLVYSENISLETISLMAGKIKKKLIDDKFKRVYFSITSENNIIKVKHPVTIVSLMETVIYFESSQTIPMWTSFKIDWPCKMYLTVVPHKEDQKMKDTYRALIMGVGEKEKTIIRSAVKQMISSK